MYQILIVRVNSNFTLSTIVYYFTVEASISRPPSKITDLNLAALLMAVLDNFLSRNTRQILVCSQRRTISLYIYIYFFFPWQALLLPGISVPSNWISVTGRCSAMANFAHVPRFMIALFLLLVVQVDAKKKRKSRTKYQFEREFLLAKGKYFEATSWFVNDKRTNKM